MIKKLYTFALVCAACVASANADVNVTATPADSSVVEELSSITLTFNDITVVDLGAKASDITLNGVSSSVNCTASYGTADNQMVVSFEKVTEKGSYTLLVPDNAFTNEDNGTAIPGFVLSYTVGSEDKATLTPAAGDVNWLSTIIYNYPVETTLSADIYNGGKAVLTSPSGKEQKLIAEYNWQIGNGKYTLRVPELTTEVGEYTLTISDNLFYCYDANYNKEWLPGGTFTYNVTGGELTEIVASPSEPIYMFNQFRVEFPGYETIAKNSKSNLYLCCEGKEGSVTSMSMDYNVSVDGNALVYVNNYSNIIDPGHYYITFPEACVLLGGEEGTPSTPFMLEFDIVEPEAANIVMTPGEGETVNMLNHVLISFPDEESVTLNSSASVYLSRINGENRISVGGAYGQSNIVKVNDNTYDARFSGLATEDGEYVITLNKNSFSFASGFNQDYEVKVNFVAPEAPVMTISPEAGSELDKIQQFTVTFPEEQVVKLNTSLSNKTTTLYVGAELNSNGYGGYSNQQAGNTSVYTVVEGSNNTFEFKLSSAAINKGDYLLVIPAGVFLMGEDENNYSRAFQAVYSATGAGVDKVEVYPDVPVRELSEMSVTFVNEQSIMFQNDYVSFSLYKVNPEQSWDDYKEYLSGETRWIENNTLYLTPAEPYTEAGEYYIEITQWSFFMSDGVTASTPQKVYWTVDPEAIETKIDQMEMAAQQRAYNLMGVEAREAKGLIIKGGKLMMVK